MLIWHRALDKAMPDSLNCPASTLIHDMRNGLVPVTGRKLLQANQHCYCACARFEAAYCFADSCTEGL